MRFVGGELIRSRVRIYYSNALRKGLFSMHNFCEVLISHGVLLGVVWCERDEIVELK